MGCRPMVCATHVQGLLTVLGAISMSTALSELGSINDAADAAVYVNNE
jgi:hypothetical protein